MPNTVLLYPRVKHTCRDTAPGLFTDQIVMYPPKWMGLSRETIAVDRCMWPVIAALWEAGVVTHACCCGHGRYAPSVYVEIGTLWWINGDNERVDRLEQERQEVVEKRKTEPRRGWFKPEE